jgi:hypothetical protein
LPYKPQAEYGGSFRLNGSSENAGILDVMVAVILTEDVGSFYLSNTRSWGDLRENISIDEQCWLPTSNRRSSKSILVIAGMKV